MSAAPLVPVGPAAPALRHASQHALRPDGLGSIVSEIAKATSHLVVGQLLQALSDWTVSGAEWLIGRTELLLTDSTRPDLGSGWFGTGYALMAEFAAAVVLPMLCCATIQAVYRQDASGLVRAFGVNLPLAMLLTGVAIALVRLSMAAVDAMSAQVLDSAVTENGGHLFVGLGDALAALAVSGNEFVVFVIGATAALAALVLWFELVLRAAAIDVAALFLPLVLAGLVWPVCSHWCRRLAETLAALIVAKLVIVSILALGMGAVDSSLHHLDLGTAVLGVTMLLLAVMAPFALLRLVPMVEGAAISHLESTRSRAIGEPLRLGHDFAMAMASGGTSAGATAATTGAAAATAGGTAATGAASGTTVGEQPTDAIRWWTDGPTAEALPDDHPEIQRQIAIIQGHTTDNGPARPAAAEPSAPLGAGQGSGHGE